MNREIKIILTDRLRRNAAVFILLLPSWFMLGLFLGNDASFLPIISAATAFFLKMTAYEASPAAQRVILQLPTSASDRVCSGSCALWAAAILLFLPLPIVAQWIGDGIEKRTALPYSVAIAAGMASVSMVFVYLLAQIGLSNFDWNPPRMPNFIRLPLRLMLGLLLLFFPYFAGFAILRAIGVPGWPETFLLTAVAAGLTAIYWRMDLAKLEFSRGAILPADPEERGWRADGGLPASGSSRRAIAFHFAVPALAFFSCMFICGLFNYGFEAWHEWGAAGDAAKGSDDDYWVIYGLLYVAWTFQASIGSLRIYRSLPLSTRMLTLGLCASSSGGAISLAAIMAVLPSFHADSISLVCICAFVFGINVLWLAFSTGWGMKEGLLFVLLTILALVAVGVGSRISGEEAWSLYATAFKISAIPFAVATPIFLRRVLTTRSQPYGMGRGAGA